jgi:hypothetical protein
LDCRGKEDYCASLLRTLGGWPDKPSADVDEARGSACCGGSRWRPAPAKVDSFFAEAFGPEEPALFGEGSGGAGWVRARINQWIGSLQDDRSDRAVFTGRPLVRIARWPGGAPFAACLTHDVDQIYDRELFRILADVNHLRRVLAGGEEGRASLCLKRITRSLLKPKAPWTEFGQIRGIEREHSWRSTFFLLEDRYWARYGSRYQMTDAAVRTVCDRLLSDGCELGLHGSYYGYADPEWFLRACDRFESVFGFRPVGARNHYLRFDQPGTWIAQAQAGLQYDSTWGYSGMPGPKGGLALPFFSFDFTSERQADVLEIPLTIMDSTLFRRQRLNADQASELATRVIEDTQEHGGLVTLLWHNNYFQEPEYSDWEETYRRLLDLLDAKGAIVLPAIEINRWWRARSRIRFETDEWREGFWSGSLTTEESIENLVVEVLSARSDLVIEVEGAAARVSRDTDRWRICFRALAAGQSAGLSVTQGPRPGH